MPLWKMGSNQNIPSSDSLVSLFEKRELYSVRITSGPGHGHFKIGRYNWYHYIKEIVRS